MKMLEYVCALAHTLKFRIGLLVKETFCCQLNYKVRGFTLVFCQKGFKKLHFKREVVNKYNRKSVTAAPSLNAL